MTITILRLSCAAYFERLHKAGDERDIALRQFIERGIDRNQTALWVPQRPPVGARDDGLKARHGRLPVGATAGRCPQCLGGHPEEIGKAHDRGQQASFDCNDSYTHGYSVNSARLANFA